VDINERINALTDARQRAWHQAKSFLDELPGDSAEWSEEQRSQWNRYNDAVDGYDADIRQLQTTERRERETAVIREADYQAFGAKAVDKRDDDVRAWLRGETRLEARDEDGKRVNGISLDVRTAARERELLRRGAGPDEIRALAWDTGNVASAVPVTMARELYQVLEANIAAFRLPTRRISTDSGESMEFPKITAHGAATQVSGQGTTLAGTDPAFSKLTLTPVKFGQLVKVASEVITDSGVDVASFVGQDIGYALARVIDTAEIGRMVPATTLGSVNTGGSLIGPTYEKMIDLVYSVNDGHRSSGNGAFLFRDSTAGSIRKIRDGAGGTEGTPLWQPGFAAGLGFNQPDTLLGYPVFTDPNVASMASNALIGAFGNWGGYYLRTVGNVLVQRDDSAGFTTDEVFFRGKWRVRGGYQDTTAVVLLKQNV
jgi:HK97 family phage major capsid protein